MSDQSRREVIERIIHRIQDEALTNYHDRLNKLRGVSSTGLPEDNERSDLLKEGFRYGYDHGRAEGYGAYHE